jgi:transcription initiation factor TFIIH subunit 4
MVLPSHFSHTLDRGTTASSKSPTEPLDAFLDNQPQAFYENIYKSEAACLCILRYAFALGCPPRIDS